MTWSTVFVMDPGLGNIVCGDFFTDAPQGEVYV